MLASDVMTREVVTVGPDTDLAEIVALMLTHRISAVPVVSDAGVIGIVSEGDLLRRAETETDQRRSHWLELFTRSETLAAEYVRSHARKAHEIMTRGAVTVAHDAPLSEVARVLESKGIKRVPVMQDGRLVGIVSRSNLLQALATRLEPPPSATRADDRTIHDALHAEIRRQAWAPLLVQCNIVVENGVVHLWGVIPSDADRKAIIVAIENTPGVKQVVDHTRLPSVILV